MDSGAHDTLLKRAEIKAKEIFEKHNQTYRRIRWGSDSHQWHIGMDIKTKGNKRLIDELIESGWVFVGKRKKEPRSIYTTEYAGYEMITSLAYYISA